MAGGKSKHTRHHANPNKEGADPDIALRAVAMTPAMATRHRNRLLRWLVAHQGWYFFPLLLLEGLSLHTDGLKRVLSRGKVERRWVEIAFLTVRLGGLAALVLAVLPPGKAVAFLAVQLAVFGLDTGSSFAPNHIGMPLVSPKLKLDFLRRQVLMSRNITGGPLISIFMGGLNYQVEHHLFPSMARPHLRKIRSLVATYCADEGVPLTQTSLWQSYRTVIGYLNTVGLKGKDPFLCPLVAQRRALYDKDLQDHPKGSTSGPHHIHAVSLFGAKHHKVRRGMEAWHRRSSCHPAASSRSSRRCRDQWTRS